MLYPVSGAGLIPVAPQSSTQNVVQPPNVNLHPPPLPMPMYQPYAFPSVPLQPQFSQLQHTSSPQNTGSQFIPLATVTRVSLFPPLQIPVTLPMAQQAFRPASPPTLSNAYSPTQQVISPLSKNQVLSFIPESLSPSSKYNITSYPYRSTSPNFSNSMPVSPSSMFLPPDSVLLENEEVYTEDDFQASDVHDDSFEQRAMKHGIRLTSKVKKVSPLQAMRNQKRSDRNKIEIINKKTQTFQEKAAMHNIVIETPDSDDGMLGTEETEDCVGILGNQVLFALQSMKSSPHLMEIVKKCREMAPPHTHHPNQLKENEPPVRCDVERHEMDIKRHQKDIVIDECEKNLTEFVEKIVNDVFDNVMEHFVDKTPQSDADSLSSPDSVIKLYVKAKSVYTWIQDECIVSEDETHISGDNLSDTSLKVCARMPEFRPKNTLFSLAVTSQMVTSPETPYKIPLEKKIEDDHFCDKSQELISSQEYKNNSDKKIEGMSSQSSDNDFDSDVKSCEHALLQSNNDSLAITFPSDHRTNHIQQLHSDEEFSLFLCDNKDSPINTFKMPLSESSLLRTGALDFSVDPKNASMISVSNSPLDGNNTDKHEHVDLYSLRPDAPEFHLCETAVVSPVKITTNLPPSRNDDILSIANCITERQVVVPATWDDQVTVKKVTDGKLRVEAPVFCAAIITPTCTSIPDSLSHPSAEAVTGDSCLVNIFPSAFPLPHSVLNTDVHPNSKDTSLMTPSAREFLPKSDTASNNEHRTPRPIHIQREVGTMTTEYFMNRCCVCDVSLTDTDTIKQKFVKCQRQLLELQAEIILKDLNKQLSDIKRQKKQWVQMFSSMNDDLSLSSMVDSKASSLELHIHSINDRVNGCLQQLDRGEPLDDLPELSVLDPGISDSKIHTQEEELLSNPELHSDVDFGSHITEYAADPNHDLHNGRNEMDSFDYDKEKSESESDVQTFNNIDHYGCNTKTILEGLIPHTIEIVEELNQTEQAVELCIPCVSENADVSQGSVLGDVNDTLECSLYDNEYQDRVSEAQNLDLILQEKEQSHNVDNKAILPESSGNIQTLGTFCDDTGENNQLTDIDGEDVRPVVPSYTATVNDGNELQEHMSVVINETAKTSSPKCYLPNIANESESSGNIELADPSMAECHQQPDIENELIELKTSVNSLSGDLSLEPKNHFENTLQSQTSVIKNLNIETMDNSCAEAKDSIEYSVTGGMVTVDAFVADYCHGPDIKNEFIEPSTCVNNLSEDLSLEQKNTVQSHPSVDIENLCSESLQESSVASGMSAVDQESSVASGMPAVDQESSVASGMSAVDQESSVASGMSAVDPFILKKVTEQLKQAYPDLAENTPMLSAVAMQQTVILQMYMTMADNRCTGMAEPGFDAISNMAACIGGLNSQMTQFNNPCMASSLPAFGNVSNTLFPAVNAFENNLFNSTVDFAGLEANNPFSGLSLQPVSNLAPSNDNVDTFQTTVEKDSTPKVGMQSQMSHPPELQRDLDLPQQTFTSDIFKCEISQTDQKQRTSTTVLPVKHTNEDWFNNKFDEPTKHSYETYITEPPGASDTTRCNDNQRYQQQQQPAVIREKKSTNKYDALKKLNPSQHRSKADTLDNMNYDPGTLNKQVIAGKLSKSDTFKVEPFKNTGEKQPLKPLKPLSNMKMPSNNSARHVHIGHPVSGLINRQPQCKTAVSNEIEFGFRPSNNVPHKKKSQQGCVSSQTYRKDILPPKNEMSSKTALFSSHFESKHAKSTAQHRVLPADKHGSALQAPAICSGKKENWEDEVDESRIFMWGATKTDGQSGRDIRKNLPPKISRLMAQRLAQYSPEPDSNPQNREVPVECTEISTSKQSKLSELCEFSPLDRNTSNGKQEETGKRKDDMQELKDWQQVTKKKKNRIGVSHVKFKTTVASTPASTNFERLVDKMMQSYPSLDRTEVIEVINMMRKSRGSLTGMSLKDIIECSVGIILKKYPSKINKGWKAPTSSPGTNCRTVLPSSSLSSFQKPVKASSTAFHHLISFTSKDDADEEDVCVICFYSLQTEKIKTLDCRHTFHDSCIKKWVLGRERTCPTCRQHALFPEEFPCLSKN